MPQGKVGLALAGGSALGFAHIGVLQVFEEEKIPIDMISGCSMGSLVGGIYASGCPLSKLEDFARVFNDKRYYDFSLPMSHDGAIKGNKVEELLTVMTQGISIEQAKIPFACNATCLEEAKSVFFTSGPMHKAIRASISIPGVFEPVKLDGMTLVDGGMMDRSSLSALELLNPDYRILVDVSYRGTPRKTPVTWTEVLFDSIELLAWKAVESELAYAQLEIVPDLQDFNEASYSDIGAIIDKGVQAAKMMLPQIKHLISME